MIDLEEANRLIDAETNRHRRKGRASVMIGVIYPYKRYIWLERTESGTVEVTLFGHHIATILPDGWEVRSCGFFTPSTRQAFESLVGYCVTMQTPGSRGGPSTEPDTGFIRGEEIPSDRWLFVPTRERVGV